MSSTRRARWHHLLFFLGPALIVYSLFLTWPLLDSLRSSFYETEAKTVDGQTTVTQTFVGLQNYQRLLDDPLGTDYDERLRNAVGNNFRFFAIFMLVQNPVALLLAALLTTRNLRGAAIYRTILFTPTTLSIVIIGWIWTLMLNPLWGIVNNVFKTIGLESAIPKEGWLGSPSLALTVVAFVIGLAGAWLSRKVEARADAFALELTENPRALIDLQRRLALTNLSDPDPSGPLERALRTHPSTVDRIGAAISFAREPASEAEKAAS